ncbi:MAG: AAA family ATPase [Candidatus Woesearchaeota archaeon]
MFTRIKQLFTGVNEEQEHLLNLLEAQAGRKERVRVQQAIKKKQTSIKKRSFHIGEEETIYPEVRGEETLNQQLQEAAYKQAYSTYSKNAYEEITQLIAPNILGLEAIKKAAALQLFSQERIHILLLGDPGTGKTEILSSSKELASISSMGLGSGTTNAGLAVTYAKGEVHKGLLVQAHKGICCIDELNLLKKEDQASLYNAMEKGFITYDKAGRSERFEADVRVLATANPKGDCFTGEKISELKKQLPFESALISRFHLLFIIRKPDKEAFLEITRKIVKNEKKTTKNKDFAQAYIKHAQKQSVKFPKHLEILVSEAAKKIKEAEEELLIEVSPRIINGIIGLSKASARMHLRETVKPEDVRNALELYAESLQITL